MLNQTGVKITSATTRKMMLISEANSVALSCVVTNTGVAAVDGRKIIKAGTPLTGNLQKRDTAFTVASSSGTPATSNAVGLAVHDVDVTDGNANAAVLIFGFVDKSKLEADVQTKITAEVETALNMIKFVV